MLETEFIKSLQSSYERVHLSEKPDDRRYQYCILTRGGIKGLLACSLRYINGQAYLYYDITSKQNTAQLCVKQLLDRKWVVDFFRSLRLVKQELGRFLLDEKNILVYGMYEQLEKNGEAYLQEKIYEDVKRLEEQSEAAAIEEERDEAPVLEDAEDYRFLYQEFDTQEAAPPKAEKLGLWKILSGKRKKTDTSKNVMRQTMLNRMEGIAVAEEPSYAEEDYGKTVYVEQAEEDNVLHKLYTPDGRVAVVLEKDNFLIGKQKEDVDMMLEDNSVSRLHARISVEDGTIYLEDLNSTNGTYKNGLRLQPYEKRRIEEGDEIRIGKLLFIFR